MNILAIDTTATYGSIAISKNSKIIYMNYMDVRVTHSERLMYQIDLGLKNCRMKIDEIDLIAIANGPGSFTGLRIGLATAKGLAFGLKIPIVPINSLKAAAYLFKGLGKKILVMKDAKMNEVYGALFDENLEEIVKTNSYKPQEFLDLIEYSVIILSDSFEKHKEIINEKLNDFKIIEEKETVFLASALIRIVENNNNEYEYSFNDNANLTPYYCRKSQAEKKINK